MRLGRCGPLPQIAQDHRALVVQRHDSAMAPASPLQPYLAALLDEVKPVAGARLLQRYPQYQDYRARVTRRFFPRIRGG